MVNYLSNFNFNYICHFAKITAPCPDQVVGKLLNGKFIPYTNRIDIDYQIANNKHSISNVLTNPVVIVLESPHKSEFDPITFNAIGPCMGISGHNFINYFDIAFSNSTLYTVLQNTIHDIVFLNAVQYQCSSGLPLSGQKNAQNKTLRDSIFINCFSTNDFDYRIHAINPSATINLCTKGLNNLQNLVELRLLNMHIANHTTGYHPSAWHSKNYRKIN